MKETEIIFLNMFLIKTNRKTQKVDFFVFRDPLEVKFVNMGLFFFFFVKQGQVVMVDDIKGEVVLHPTNFSFFFKKKSKVVMGDDSFSGKRKVKSSLYMTTSLFRFFF